MAEETVLPEKAVLTEPAPAERTEDAVAVLPLTDVIEGVEVVFLLPDVPRTVVDAASLRPPVTAPDLTPVSRFP